MLPQIKLEAVGHGIDAAFAPALRVAQSCDPARPAEAVRSHTRFADTAHLVELAGTDPLRWACIAAANLDRLHGPANPAATCLAELIDQDFARSVLLPTYLEAVAADQPVVHRIAAVASDRFLCFRRLTVPLRTAPRAARPSHLLMLTQLDCALPLSRAPGGGGPLTVRERQCLSLVAGGLGGKRIAAALGVSAKTVELHLAHARRKLGARTTAQAVAAALVLALLEPLTG